MNCIHGNKLNKLAEFNLLNEILNPPKLTKKLNTITLLLYKDVWIYERVNQVLRTFENYWLVDWVPWL